MNQIQDPTALLPTITFTGAGASDRTNRYPVKPKSENVELSLGLSLNGKFGLEPQRSMPNKNNNKLIRASSASNFVNFPVDVELSLNMNMNMNSPLTRSCSLPPETEVEWRKRKELQSLRRLEAKRRRVEKLNNGMKQCQPSPSPAISKPPAAPVKLPSQGSIGSQESGGSSGVSDLDSKPFAGTNKGTSKTNEGSELGKLKSNPTIKPDEHYAYNETMPCVSTKGDGPNGRRIQGFLYRYGKDEEVRIVCVCHGSFLTPAEFVKHGGGGDVEHPLRHILVTSLFR